MSVDGRMPSSRPDGSRDFMSTLPVAVYTTDADGFITDFNPAAAELAGRLPEIGRDRWCVTWRLYWPNGAPMRHDECPMALALKENRIIRGAEAIAERPDGSRFRFTPHPTPIRNTDGVVTGGLNVLVDITGRNGAESVRQAVVPDIDSKVAGILRLVDAILRDAQRQARGAEAQKIMQHAIGGVAAVAAIHGLFHDTGAEGGISGWDLLSATCMTVQMELDKGVELLCQSSSDTLPNDVAMPLALVAKELIGNAARHGRNGRPKMLVRVGLRRESGGYAFTVEDDGPGFTLGPEHARSFGLGLVMALARQLNGELEVSRAPGARCTLRFPDPRTLN